MGWLGESLQTMQADVEAPAAESPVLALAVEAEPSFFPNARVVCRMLPGVDGWPPDAVAAFGPGVEEGPFCMSLAPLANGLTEGVVVGELLALLAPWVETDGRADGLVEDDSSGG